MGSPYITPAFFFMNSLQEFLIGNKALTVRDKAEFIRSMTQHVDEEATQAVRSYLMMSSAQDDSSSNETIKLESQIPGGSRERDYIPDVGETGHKLDQSLKPETKTGVRDRTEFSEL